MQVTITDIVAGSVSVRTTVQFPASSVEAGSTAFATLAVTNTAALFAGSPVAGTYGAVTVSAVRLTAEVHTPARLSHES